MSVRNPLNLIVAGIVGTLAMSAVAAMAPMMGLPPMNPAAMMGDAMGGSTMIGWAAHLMVGVVLAGAFSVVRGQLPGPTGAQGAVFAVGPWLLAQLAVMPMMGLGLLLRCTT